MLKVTMYLLESGQISKYNLLLSFQSETRVQQYIFEKQFHIVKAKCPEKSCIPKTRQNCRHNLAELSAAAFLKMIAFTDIF